MFTRNNMKMLKVSPEGKEDLVQKETQVQQIKAGKTITWAGN